jgi:NAD(P)-dependent dehydrogenase (short-subunit alcohol dehydrogenase family)
VAHPSSGESYVTSGVLQNRRRCSLGEHPQNFLNALPRRAGVDLLVNNVGIGQRGMALETQFDVYRRLMEVDFFAPLRLTQLNIARDGGTSSRPNRSG